MRKKFKSITRYALANIYLSLDLCTRMKKKLGNICVKPPHIYICIYCPKQSDISKQSNFQPRQHFSPIAFVPLQMESAYVKLGFTWSGRVKDPMLVKL